MNREKIQNKINELELKRERYLRLADISVNIPDGTYCQEKAVKIQKKIDRLQDRLDNGDW